MYDHSGAVIGFGDNPDFGTITEGSGVFFSLDTEGFSYGTISVQVTPLPCSDYPGNLSALFDNVPAASASAGMWIVVFPVKNIVKLRSLSLYIYCS